MKKCFKCGVEQELSCFYPHPRMRDGHLNKCIGCTKLDVKARRFGPQREAVLAYDRSRGNRQTAQDIRDYRAANPNKYKAHGLVARAITSGKLFREPCCVCGKQEPVVAHHDDYAKPLNVRWMCQAHHLQWHAEHGQGLNP